MFHHYPFLSMDLLIAINPLNNVLPEQLLNLWLADECLRSSKDFWLEERHSFKMPALQKSLCRGLESYFTFALPTSSYPANSIREAKESSLEGRQDFLWPHQNKTDHASFPFSFLCRSQQQSKRFLCLSPQAQAAPGLLGVITLHQPHISIKIKRNIFTLPPPASTLSSKGTDYAQNELRFSS